MLICYEKFIWLIRCFVKCLVHYRSELWDHLFFGDCLNYLNFNSVSDEICTLNNVKAINIIFKISLE